MCLPSFLSGDDHSVLPSWWRQTQKDRKRKDRRFKAWAWLCAISSLPTFHRPKCLLWPGWHTHLYKALCNHPQNPSCSSRVHVCYLIGSLNWPANHCKKWSLLIRKLYLALKFSSCGQAVHISRVTLLFFSMLKMSKELILSAESVVLPVMYPSKQLYNLKRIISGLYLIQTLKKVFDLRIRHFKMCLDNLSLSLQQDFQNPKYLPLEYWTITKTSMSILSFFSFLLSALKCHKQSTFYKCKYKWNLVKFIMAHWTTSKWFFFLVL